MSLSIKILHVLDHSLPLHSGYAFRSASLFREQIRRGWTPVVVTSPKHEASWKGKWAQRETIEGVRYYRCGTLDVPNSGTRRPSGGSTLNWHWLNLRPFSELRLIKRLQERIVQVARVEQPDVLHAHSPVLNGLAALAAARRLGIPLVYEIRAFWEDAAVDHGTTREGSLRYRLIRALETLTCLKADHVAVLCNGIRGDLVRRGISAQKITPIYNGVDVEAFSRVPSNDECAQRWGLNGKTVIGFIGSFYRYEGLDLLIEAFDLLARDLDDVRLLLVGGGQAAGDLRALVSQKSLDQRVLMPGRIPHGNIPAVYGLVDILAYPRYPMRLTELVTPLKPLEAMAMGKAIVASDVGGHREQIQHGRTGFLFAAGSVSSLHSAIKALSMNAGLRHALGSAARAWVMAERSWQRTTEPQTAIYTKILRKRACS